MMRKFLLVFLLFAGQLHAQSLLRLQHFNVEDGLSQSSVYEIFQDRHGFMWFSTGDGLDKFDGRDFTVYKGRLTDTSSEYIRARNVNSALFEDGRDRLWMAITGGVCYFDTRHNIFRFVHRQYTTAVAINGATLWTTQCMAGIYGVDINTLEIHFHKFSSEYKLQAGDLCNTHNGVVYGRGLWMADDRGLLFFDTLAFTDKRILFHNDFNSVNKLRDGRMMICSKGKVFLYDPAYSRLDSVSISGSPYEEGIQWRCFAEDTAGHYVYIGAQNSGKICRLSTADFSRQMLDFQNNNVYGLKIDRSGNLWIGTDGNGVFKLDIKQPKFYCYSPASAAEPGNATGLMVKSIYRDEAGMIWIGSFTNGLIRLDPVKNEKEVVVLDNVTPNSQIDVIRKDSGGNMLITSGPYMTWLDARTQKILRQVKLPVMPAISSNYPDIYAVVEWKKGHFLAATNIGLYTISVTDNFVPRHVRKLNMWMYSLVCDQDGQISIGRREGFSRIHMADDTTFQIIDDALDNIAVRHTYHSLTYPVNWLATEMGLVAYNDRNKNFKVFDELAGFQNSFIYGILAENDSTLWVSTNRGLSKVRVQYNDTRDIRILVTNYNDKDGLQSDEFNTGAYFKDRDGTLFFGGIAGINWFRPVEMKINPYAPEPALAGIYINDRLYAADTAMYIQTLDLPYNKNTISLSLRALEYTQPLENQFAYKLEGLEDDWVYTSGDKVRYSNLLPGIYTFLLKVSNNEGVWNNTPLKLMVIINPPYWQTWWFRSLLLLAVAVIAIFSARYYIQGRVRARTLELEKQHALDMERTRISKDVHDDLGSGLSKISLIADIAGKRVNGNVLLGNDISHISSMSKELIENMRDLVWVLNPENTTLDQLVARLREYCADYMENIPVSVSLRFPASVPHMRISRESQRNVFLTVKEAINNCIKHAHATKIEVNLVFELGLLEIEIIDNGDGFDMANLKGSGNGLRNMRHRIEAIGGSFGIDSDGAGTRIRISLPADKLCSDKITL